MGPGPPPAVRRVEEIVFTQNTTHAINLVAHSFPFAPGDVVVTSDQEHNSNLLPWQQLSRDGVAHRAVAFGDLGALRASLTPAVKLVSMVMTSNLDGASIDARPGRGGA
jgi:cysteine desulfurase/selenocysteine lyase